MGLEQKSCCATIKGVEWVGTLHLDSKVLEFRCSGCVWNVPLGTGTRARNEAGMLVVSRGPKKASFQLKAKTDHWVKKILHPPTRPEKLGVKSGQSYVLVGGTPAFAKELRAAGLRETEHVSSADLVFMFLPSKAELKRFDDHYQRSKTATHFWIVWPKGVEAIRQADVIANAKELGMGPGKVMSFDDSLTAMRFTKRAR
ncbi:MAG: hypothetical protein AAGJ83_05685 [Planctomycetota bacterium]